MPAGSYCSLKCPTDNSKKFLLLIYIYIFIHIISECMYIFLNEMKNEF